MPGPNKLSLARLCLNGVISPQDYLFQKKIRHKSRPVVEHSGIPFNLADYSDDECKLYFRFSQAEIVRLVTAFHLRKKYILRSRTKFTGIEGFCILLRRLAFPNRLCELVKLFNRDISALSKIIHFMLETLYENHAKKLQRFSQPWLTQDILETFAEVCSEAGSPYPNIVGFIDGTIRSICRPSKNQRPFYSGYKRKHCVKYQSTVFPNGLIGRLDGPYIGRRHDSAILHISKILDEMKTLFVNPDGTNFAVYGDPGYSNQKFIKVGFKNYTRLTEKQQQFNHDLSSVRVSVEYGFGQILKQFAFLDFKKGQKVNETPIKKQYYVAALLTNCQNCMHQNQISTYFNCLPPTLEEYLTF